MDIVRTNVERLNGQVTVHSTSGKGSEVTIELPLTLATTILGDGSLGLIVDTASLINETARASA